MVSQPDILLSSFGAAGWGEWRADGVAFSGGPAEGAYTDRNQPPIEGHGKCFINSFFGDQYATGTLKSPSFELCRKYINFKMAGICHPTDLCVALVIDGADVRSASPRPAIPAGRYRWTDVLTAATFDVSTLIGQVAHLEIRDRHRNGYILVDEIVHADRPSSEHIIDAVDPWRPAHLKKRVDERFLVLPVCQEDPLQDLKLEVDGELLLEFQMQLALSRIDGYVPIYDLLDFMALEVSIDYHAYDPGSPIPEFRLVDSVDSMKENSGSIQTGFHIMPSPSVGFLNDPNGLIYYEGDYHLFHQFAILNMRSSHWAHWVSQDLVHWEERPIALFPDRLGSMHSGSAVIDRANTGGFRTGKNIPIVCFFTGSHGMGGRRKVQVQGLAYSNNRGRSFSKYDGNPIIGTERGAEMATDNNRDPKVFWFEPASHWVMVLYERNGLSIFTSDDLRSWAYQSHREGFNECPELFELPLDGDTSQSYWILYGGRGEYLIGQFDGKTFQELFPDKTPLTSGNSFYASQTFNNMPDEDGRRILVAWMSEQLSFPVELTLRSTKSGPRIFANPVREIQLLYGESTRIDGLDVDPGRPIEVPSTGGMYDINSIISVGSADAVELAIHGVIIRYDVRRRALSCRECETPLTAEDGSLELRIVVDTLSAEIFACDGLIYMPMRVDFDPLAPSATFYSFGGSARLDSLVVNTLSR